MKYFTILLLLAVGCTALAGPSAVMEKSLVRHRRDLELLGNTRKLLEDLIKNLKAAADKARSAVAEFNSGVMAQANLFKGKFLSDLNRLRDQVTGAMQTVSEKISESNTAVKECVTSQSSAAGAVFNQAYKDTLSCADERLQEASDLVKGLIETTDEVHTFVTQAYAEMKNCTQDASLLAAGGCLGRVVVKAEIKGATFLAQSGVAIARLNIFLTTLPASLEVCAGKSLVTAGVSTAKILIEIGGCSTSSVFSTITGSASIAGNAATNGAGTITDATSITANAATAAASNTVNAANVAVNNAATAALTAAKNLV